MNILDVLKSLVNADKLGGWVRAGVGALLAALIARFPGLSDILDPVTQATIGTIASTIVVGAWSHAAKALSK